MVVYWAERLAVKTADLTAVEKVAQWVARSVAMRAALMVDKTAVYLVDGMAVRWVAMKAAKRAGATAALTVGL